MVEWQPPKWHGASRVRGELFFKVKFNLIHEKAFQANLDLIEMNLRWLPQMNSPGAGFTKVV